jgi:hypothetical protein
LGALGLFNYAVREIPLASFANLLIQVNELTQLLFRQRVGFLSLGKRWRRDKERSRQVRQHPLATAPAGIVAIEQQGNETGAAGAIEARILVLLAKAGMTEKQARAALNAAAG